MIALPNQDSIPTVNPGSVADRYGNYLMTLPRPVLLAVLYQSDQLGLSQ